jgi:Zn-dependent metalloprotease
MNCKTITRASLCCLLFAAAFFCVAFAFSTAAIGQQAPAPSSGAASDAAAIPQANEALANLQRTAQAQIVTQVAPETGAYTFVRTEGAGVLAADHPLAKPEDRARVFLGANGALLGMSEAERSKAADPDAATNASRPVSELVVARVLTDGIGATHVRFNQIYGGLKVFGGEVIVHMNDRGITAVNGNFIPNITVDTRPALTEEMAAQKALESVAKANSADIGKLIVGEIELAIYRTGLLEGYEGKNVLAYSVKIADGQSPLEQVWISAATGAELIRIPLKQSALYRRVYSPRYDSSNPDMFVVRDENDPIPSPIPQIEGLFQFSGQTYNMFASAFGRDSFNGMGAVMRTVYLVNSICPNAYWDGATTNYCPEIDGDDVVAHEWGHAYTQFTHNLVYSFQSGALNESYSDIWGDTVDIHNGMDGEGGSNNAQPAPAGQRWLIGEDVAGLGPLRDMWSPTTLGDPDKVSSASYFCAATDGGGVHTNSGVPNHAYAIIVDGKTFNGQTVTGIGFTKAMHIYFRAMAMYQHSTTNFPHHAQSLLTACNDLAQAGTNLNGFSLTSPNGTPSGQVITAADCGEVRKAMAAVEMQRRPVQCNFGPLLDPNTPADCPANTLLFGEDWETGMDGWTLLSQGEFAGWPNFNWELDNSLPANRPGSAAFAWGFGGGVCGDPNGDYSGKFSITSPTITAGPNDTDLQLSFEHFVASEFLVDGGNVLISVNGGAFQLIPQANYTFNAPPSQLRAPPPVDQNTNPKAGEFAWSGADPEVPAFGTTKADLSSLVQPGDSFKLRFEFGLDGCGGNQGWYVDNIRVFNCPLLETPTLMTGAGYQNPDPDGRYELIWTRPAGATGPDVLQVSDTSCGPLVFENAEAGMTNWTVSTTGTYAGLNWSNAPAGEKPHHNSQTYRARAAEGVTNASAIMTYNSPIAIPAAGVSTLRFQHWYMGESDDGAFVEVSEDGTTWNAVFTDLRSELAPIAGEFFGTEPLFQRQVDLTPYNGRTIRLRFRHFAGPDNRAGSSPFGWYVDNITISNEHWTDVLTTPNTSVFITGQPAGTRCYRVRTTYTFGSEQAPSPFSAPVTVNVAAGPPPTSAVSRKTHDGTPYDVDLPLAGRGVECRQSSSGPGSHQVIFNFPAPVTIDYAAMEGNGSVTSFTPSGSQIAVGLSGVMNGQNIRVTLGGVSDGTTTGSVSVRMGALYGDTNANGIVNASDVSQTKAQSGQPLSLSNFRTDVNTTGGTTATDISIVKSQAQTGMQLPP